MFFYYSLCIQLMRIMLVFVMIANLMMTGCIASPYGNGDIDFNHGLSGWEMTHHFEKDENNQTVETLTELEIEFNAYSNINATFVEFWLMPGDGSDTKRVDPQETKYIQHQYTGYGAFMNEYGVIDSEGNEDKMPYSKYDWPALIRSGNFYLNQSSASQPADLYIDAPHPNSVGSAEWIGVESTIGNSWALPFTSEPTDITWSLIDPDGTVVDQHTETLDVGDDYTWESYLESPKRGAWLLTVESSADVNIDQTTLVRMSYAGFLYNH